MFTHPTHTTRATVAFSTHVHLSHVVARASTRGHVCARRVCHAQARMGLHGDATETRRMEAEYKLAKARYKLAKAQLRHMDVQQPDVQSHDVSASHVDNLRREYRAKKDLYKTHKRSTSSLSVALPAPVAAKPQQGEGEGEEDVVVVCGGKACQRLGADAVALLLNKRGTRVSHAQAACMKQCGGVGPSVMCDGRVTKVDLQSAINNAISP